MERKERKTYYFSVEGETEQRYLKWLQDTINSSPLTRYIVKIDCPIEKDPLKRAKRLNSLGKTEITHVFDYESLEPVHAQQFITALDRMKEAQSRRVGKGIKYRLGYCNFTFELWMVLHKTDCNGGLTHRGQYLIPINNAYDESFEDLKQYKHEASFKRILGKLTLDDVKKAILRAKIIMQSNEENGLTLQQYRGYRYYKENPSLSIEQSIEKILKDCELL